MSAESGEMVGSWVDANPLDPSFQTNPHPRLKRLRELDPVNQTPVGIWRLSNHEDCLRLLTELPTGVRTKDGSFPAEALLPSGGQALFMLQQDPPNHTRLRKLVSKAFSPRAIERLQSRTLALADEIIEGVSARGSMDIISEYALPIPSTIICEMMGVPLADRQNFTTWTAQATHLLAALIAPSETLELGQQAVANLNAYFEDLIAERRLKLRDDILSDLIRAEEAGERLSTPELVAQCRGLLIAGFETTIGLIGNGILALLTHPDQLALLRNNPELLNGAIEECLRFDGPIQVTVRYLREDSKFGGKLIPEGSQVWAMLSAANRDPRRFSEPDRFDITRTDNPHLAFGGGAHFCLGAHLARMEARIAIGSLVCRMRQIEVVSQDLEWGRSLFRVLSHLPVSFIPAV